MAKKKSNGIDLVGSELQNARMHNLGTAPASPGVGQVWYNTTDGYLYLRDGSGNRQLTTLTQVLGLRLDQFTAPNVALSMANQRIINLLDPTNPQDAATKAYVDALISGMRWKDAARVGSTTNISLSGLQTIDGVTVAAGDRVAVMGQTTGSQNGIYVAASGAWARSEDANTSAEVFAMSFFVSEGTNNGNKVYVCTTDAPISLGSTALAFSLIGSSTSFTQGTGILISGNQISIDTSVVTRKVVGQVGNGSSTSFTLLHNLGTKAIGLFMRKVSTDEAWDPDFTTPTINTVTVNFYTAPTTNEFEIVIFG
nr:hypothetical protein [uncultured Arsenicibacter sp.]